MSDILRTFLAHEVPLKRFLSRFLTNPHDVDDIAQETFLRAFAAEATQTVLTPKAFLFRIAKNLALNETARMWNLTTKSLGDFPLKDVLEDGDAVSGEDRVDARRKLVLFAHALSTLPPQCRRVFLLRKIHGLSQKEIALKLNISIGTVEKHVAAGVLKCSEYLNRHGYEVGNAKAVPLPAETRLAKTGRKR